MRRQSGKIIAKLQLQLQVGEAHCGGGRQIYNVEFAGIHQQSQLLALGVFLIGGIRSAPKRSLPATFWVPNSISMRAPLS